LKLQHQRFIAGYIRLSFLSCAPLLWRHKIVLLSTIMS
jgi:hypothetical protein